MTALRIDYVKLVFKSDYDYFQANIYPRLNSIEHNGDLFGNGRWPAKLTSLGADSDGKRRYVYEAWGEYANTVAAKMPHEYWTNVRRLDVRSVYDTITGDQIAALGAFYAVNDSAKVNISLINSKPRKKDNQRDVGGKGITIGSRKSDRHAVLYKRGAEPVAYEYRVQNKAAAAVGQLVAEALANNISAHPEDVAAAILYAESCDWLQKTLGVRTPEQLASAGQNMARQMEQLASQPHPFEVGEADQWAAADEPDFQAMLQATFLPTTKGWKE